MPWAIIFTRCVLVGQCCCNIAYMTAEEVGTKLGKKISLSPTPHLEWRLSLLIIPGDDDTLGCGRRGTACAASKGACAGACAALRLTEASLEACAQARAVGARRGRQQRQQQCQERRSRRSRQSHLPPAAAWQPCLCLATPATGNCWR